MGKTIEESGRPGSLRRRRGIGGVDSKQFVRQRELQAPGLAPQPAAKGKNEKIAAAVQNLLSGLTGAAGALKDTMDQIHDFDVKADEKDLTDQIYKGLVEGRTSPNFRTDEGFEAYQNAMAFELTADITKKDFEEFSKNAEEGDSLGQTLHSGLMQKGITTDPGVFKNIYLRLVPRYAAYVAGVSEATAKKMYTGMTGSIAHDMSVNVADGVKKANKAMITLNADGIGPWSRNKIQSDTYWAAAKIVADRGDLKKLEEIGRQEVKTFDPDGKEVMRPISEVAPEIYAGYVNIAKEKKEAEIKKVQSEILEKLRQMKPEEDARILVRKEMAKDGGISQESALKLMNIAKKEEGRKLIERVKIMGEHKGLGGVEISAVHWKFIVLERGHKEGLISSTEATREKYRAISMETSKRALIMQMRSMREDDVKKAKELGEKYLKELKEGMDLFADDKGIPNPNSFDIRAAISIFSALGKPVKDYAAIVAAIDATKGRLSNFHIGNAELTKGDKPPEEGE